MNSSTSNLQHRSPNLQPMRSRRRWMLNVRCWMLDVCYLPLFACLGGGLGAHLSASEPPTLPSDNPPAVAAVTETASAAPTTPAAPTAPAAPRLRTFGEADLLELLTATLQKES